MRLARKTEYALRALAELAMVTEDQEAQPVQARRLARTQNIPVKFLEQILVTLKNAGLVHSRRGRHGGYVLARPADEIFLGEVIRLFEGPSAIGDSAPLDLKEADERAAACGVRSMLAQVGQALSRTFDRLSLDDACRRSERLRRPASAHG